MSAVLAMHDLLLDEHGGPSGIRSKDLLESSLASPRNLLAYGSPDLCDLAAKYAASLTLNHPFQDGNKRVALTVAGVFLELNGRQLNAPEPDAVRAVLALSTKEMSEAEFAEWLRRNSRTIPKPKPRPKPKPSPARKRAKGVVRKRK